MIAPPFDAHALENDRCVVQPVTGAPTRSVGTAQLALLQSCDRLATLNQHAATITQRFPGIGRSSARNGLRELRALGLLIDETTLHGFFASGVVDQRAPLETLFIRSSGRPRALSRALGSLARVAPKLSRCVVLDDTEDADRRAQVDACLDRFRSELTFPLRHFRRDRRNALIDRLARETGASADRIGWFVHGDPGRSDRYGCGLNLALLLAAGQRMLLLDDDASLDAFAARGQGGATRIAAGHQMQGRVLAAANEDELIRLEQFDPVAHHASALGSPVAGTDGNRLGFESLTPNSLLALRPGGRIRLTVNGVRGDPGTRQPHWLYAQAAERLQAWAREAEYRQALAARRAAHGEPGPRRILEYGFMTTTLSGIDNADELLPTLPYAVGEDTMLGELIRLAYPGSALHAMPWMLHHAPETDRSWTREDARLPLNHNIGNFFRLMLRDRVEPLTSDAYDVRVAAVMAAFGEVARAEPDRLENECLRQTIQQRTGFASRLVAGRHNFTEWPHVLEDIDRMIEANSVAGWHATDRPDAWMATVRALATGYARGLEDWRAAWHAARKLGSEALLNE